MNSGMEMEKFAKYIIGYLSFYVQVVYLFHQYMSNIQSNSIFLFVPPFRYQCQLSYTIRIK